MPIGLWLVLPRCSRLVLAWNAEREATWTTGAVYEPRRRLWCRASGRFSGVCGCDDAGTESLKILKRDTSGFGVLSTDNRAVGDADTERRICCERKGAGECLPGERSTDPTNLTAELIILALPEPVCA
jgi:hypothetical protein